MGLTSMRIRCLLYTVQWSLTPCYKFQEASLHERITTLPEMDKRADADIVLLQPFCKVGEIMFINSFWFRLFICRSQKSKYTKHQRGHQTKVTNNEHYALILKSKKSILHRQKYSQYWVKKQQIYVFDWWCIEFGYFFPF